MRLLHLDSEGIQKLISNMEKDCEIIKRTALKFSWYMRGGVSYEDIMNMSAFEREEIGRIIDSNIETTKKSGLNFF